MVWKINLATSADKELSKLPKDIQLFIRNYLKNKVMKSPREYGKSLVSSSKIKLWRYRVQNYRMICQIQDQEVTVLVVRIAKRDSVYKNL